MSSMSCERCGYYECQCVSERTQYEAAEETNELLRELIAAVREQTAAIAELRTNLSEHMVVLRIVTR